jgi:cupin 2 domain-containing protein
MTAPRPGQGRVPAGNPGAGLHRASPPAGPGGYVWGRLLPASAAPPRGESDRSLVTSGGLSVRQVLSGRLDTPVAYLQQQDEWALVVSGGARLQVPGEEIELGPGEWVWLPAGTAHTLVSTVPGTSWVTVHHLSPSGGTPAPPPR